MRISDWSSDVCSSDLPAAFRILAEPLELGENPLPVGFGHAAALIVDRYSRLAFPHLQSQPDRTGVPRKLPRALDEVDEHLARPPAIAPDEHRHRGRAPYNDGDACNRALGMDRPYLRQIESSVGKHRLMPTK